MALDTPPPEQWVDDEEDKGAIPLIAAGVAQKGSRSVVRKVLEGVRVDAVKKCTQGRVRRPATTSSFLLDLPKHKLSAMGWRTGAG